MAAFFIAHLPFANGFTGCSGEKRKVGVGAAAVPIMQVVWPGVVVKGENGDGCGRGSHLICQWFGRV